MPLALQSTCKSIAAIVAQVNLRFTTAAFGQTWQVVQHNKQQVNNKKYSF